MGLGLKLCHSIGHRYVVVGMCSTGMALTTLNRLLFSLILKEMIYKRRHGAEDQPVCPATTFEHDHTPGMEEFMWGNQLQVYILGGFITGFAMGRLPAGLATDKLGAKTLFGYSMFIPGVCCVLTPLCARTGPYVMLVNQLIMGIFTSVQDPCMAWLAVRWFPIGQMGIMLAIMFSGFPLGMALRFYASNHVFNYYWTVIFYVCGFLSILHAYFWQAIIWDDPFEHPYISMRELELLVDKVPMYYLDFELDPGWSWPWKAIFTSRSVWTMSFAYLGYSWCLFFAFVIMPTLYFPAVHAFYFLQHPNVGLCISLMVIVTILVAGLTIDKLVQSKMYSNTHISKTYYSIGTILSSLLFVGLAHSECARTTVFIYYTAAVACLGVGYTTFAAAAISVAPNFAGTLVSLTTFLGVVTIPFHLSLQQSMTKESSLKEWKTVTYLNGAIAIFTTAVFLKAGRCVLRPWNQPEKLKREKMAAESDDDGAGPTGVDDEGKSKQVGVAVEPVASSPDVTPHPSDHNTMGPAASISQQRLEKILLKKSLRAVSSSKSLTSIPHQKSLASVHWRELIQSQLRKDPEEKANEDKSKSETSLGEAKSQSSQNQTNRK